MDSAQPRCVEHVEVVGQPCTRCGTFRCETCLSSGLCPSCRRLQTAHPPIDTDAVGFGRRAGARIIDLVVGQGVALGAGVFAAITLAILEQLGLARSGWLQRFDHGFGFNFLGGLTANLVAAAIGVSLCGASVGKALLGLRVVNLEGHRAGLVANVVRELGYFIDALFFGLIGKGAMDGSPLQQRYGDQWASTVVVRRDTLSDDVASSPLRLIIGLGLGLFIHGAVLTAFFVFAGR